MIKFMLSFILLVFSSQVFAKNQIFIKVGDAKVRKSMLAFPSIQFFGSPQKNPEYQHVGAKLFKTIRNDLDISYYFQFIDPKAFIENPAKTTLKPAPGDANGFNFANWRTIGTEFLLRAGFQFTGKDVELDIYLYHVPKGDTLLSRKYKGKKTDLDSIAHTVTNDLIFRLTGKKGIFKTKLLFSSDRDSTCRPGKKACSSWKEIYVSDYDGKNIKRVTRHKSISISPNWAPDGNTIVYTSYAYHPKTKMRNPDLFSYELNTKKSFLLSWRKGVNSGGTFTPDGKNVYLTISKSGNADIYRMDKNGKNIKNITKGPLGALNVEPAVSPDGKRLAFSSDRNGRPMIYIMDINGKNVKRITRAGRYNSTPSWSPDSKSLVFAGWDKGHFDLFLVSDDGIKLTRLTTAKKVNGKMSNNEDPSFSPDGRHIVFVSDRSGKKQVYMISPDGSNERRITFDSANYYKPKWSYMME